MPVTFLGKVRCRPKNQLQVKNIQVYISKFKKKKKQHSYVSSM